MKETCVLYHAEIDETVRPVLFSSFVSPVKGVGPALNVGITYKLDRKSKVLQALVVWVPPDAPLLVAYESPENQEVSLTSCIDELVTEVGTLAKKIQHPNFPAAPNWTILQCVETIGGQLTLVLGTSRAPFTDRVWQHYEPALGDRRCMQTILQSKVFEQPMRSTWRPLLSQIYPKPLSLPKQIRTGTSGSGPWQF